MSSYDYCNTFHISLIKQIFNIKNKRKQILIHYIYLKICLNTQYMNKNI